ncbi:unnamed protein product [Protopolystoma xenopodis]|uniref:PLAT domain-containing protein n=1 Tax=Protopolystoma xenopodis TaxID=117903 RepID=A0A448WFR5_9PLAT|nr:unnamed protein product [Protopolystoma xenopodis]
MTSDKFGAGTDATVYIQLYGASGEATEKVVLANRVDSKKCFERKSRDVFFVQLEEISEPLSKLRIGHNGSGVAAGWHLDRVEVPITYVFPCNRWLAKDEEDGALDLDLLPTRVMKGSDLVETGPGLSTKLYQIRVITADVKEAGTNANVFLTLYGDKGDSGERKLDKSETHRDKFEQGKMYSHNFV